jgi:prepilin-type N-terminal cleavage/methylation domain-containing protein
LKYKGLWKSADLFGRAGHAIVLGKVPEEMSENYAKLESKVCCKQNLQADRMNIVEQQGYTMIEIFVVIAIAAILVAVAVPSLQDTVTRNARDSIQLELMTSLALAQYPVLAHD